MRPTPLLPSLLLTASFITTPYAEAIESSTLLQRLNALESRVTALEQQQPHQQPGKNRWKEPTLWHRIINDMRQEEVEAILGKPHRVEETIFTTWYYHPTSKQHSFVWFDEGKVLGWKAVH